MSEQRFCQHVWHVEDRQVISTWQGYVVQYEKCLKCLRERTHVVGPGRES